MIKFNPKDNSTWPPFGKRVNIKVVESDGAISMEMQGEVKPPNINLKHDRIDAATHQLVMDMAYFDTDEGLLVTPTLKDHTQHLEWAV